MHAAWSGRVKDLKQLLMVGAIETTLEQGLKDNLQQGVSPAERDAWKNSISALLETVLAPSVFANVQVILEQRMPIGSERADVVLLGGAPDNPRAFVLELKQWSSVLESNEEVYVPGWGVSIHPSKQALTYMGRLQLFHSAGKKYDWRAGAFLHNITADAVRLLKSKTWHAFIQRAPLYGPEDTILLQNAIREHLLPNHLNDDDFMTFTSGEYTQSTMLINILREHALDIGNRVESVLAERGVGLTAEQDHLVSEVFQALKSGSRKAFIVQGGPGSGKTLVAVTILLRAITLGYRSMLALRNNRLQAVLRTCLNEAYPGISQVLNYFELQNGTGIGNEGWPATFDLVVLDEAQRMRRRSMGNALRRAPVSVVFLDEGQRLNPPEEGNIQAFSQAARESQISSEPRMLRAAVRCRGGDAYHQWVEGLLATPWDVGTLTLRSQPWIAKYQFKVCQSVDDLMANLVRLRESGFQTRVATVASFTEAPGLLDRQYDPNNLRVGYPLVSSFEDYRDSQTRLWWLMRPDEYVRFWVSGESNRLERVASVYGAQGFESDYVGVIWGRDFIYRREKWALGDPNACYDSIDGLVSRRVPRSWAPDALPLVINRYRIFLTRGIRGTLVYCEDMETRRLLKSLVAP
jgi:uncharacterized protein